MAGRPFWLRPKWVVGHVLCLALIVLFVNLGFWQLRRLDEKQERGARIDARMDDVAVPLEDALAGGPEAAEYRRVRVRGRWDAAGTVLVRSRALNGQPGYHVVTPLVTDGRAVLVNRGFTPILPGGEDRLVDRMRPEHDGTVTVEGVVRVSEERGGIGPTDPSGELLAVVNRIDVERLQEQVDVPLAPVFVQLTWPEPRRGSLPAVLPEPEVDDGPHLAYAVQWFIFAAVGAVGWPLLLRKTAREQAAERAGGTGVEAPG